MNRAERRAEERAYRRGLVIIHEELLPGGCSRCRGAERLRWFGLADAYDLIGFDKLNHLIDPLGDLSDDEEVSIWSCECGASGAFAWGVLKQP